MEWILEANNISFSYRNAIILHHLNLFVQSHDFIMAAGSNGTGKSTLMKLLTNEYKPTEGQVYWFGQPIQQFKQWHTIGYVPQHNPLIESQFPATVDEIVLSGLYKDTGFLRFPGKTQKEKAKKALEYVGMAGFERQKAGCLSGGQQQKVMLARAIVHNPAMLLLDEPTAGIDHQSSLEIYQLLKTLNEERGLTILMITHDTEQAAQYAKRCFVLAGGHFTEMREPC